MPDLEDLSRFSLDIDGGFHVAEMLASIGATHENRRAEIADHLGPSILFLEEIRQGQLVQGGPASVRKVPLSENHPSTPIVGAPKNQEKNANSCKLYVKPLGMVTGGIFVPVSGFP